MNSATEQHARLIDTWKQQIGPDAAALLQAGNQPVVGELGGLRQLLRERGARNVLVVIDSGAVAATSSQDLLAEQMRDTVGGWFNEFTPNPTSDQALEAARRANHVGADTIVAFGGGSAMDVAKVAACAARHPDAMEALTRGEDVDQATPLPVIAIPTTSGTGSEATHFAAIYVDGRKKSIGHPAMRPVGVVLDVGLHEAMPADLAAVTGLDALAQALESMWAVGSTTESLKYAEAAARLVTQALEASVATGKRAERLKLMIGAHLAGQAINISKTTAAHALSYQFTQRLGLPHGHAVALVLGVIAAQNALVDGENCQDARGPEHVRAQVLKAAGYLDCEPLEMPQTISRLLDRMDLASTFEAIGADNGLVKQMALAVDPVRLGNNPRRFSGPELADILLNETGYQGGARLS